MACTGSVGDAAALVAAINAANASAADDVLELGTDCTYTLTTPAVANASAGDPTYPQEEGPVGLPLIVNNGSLTINGNGATIERSSASDTPDFRILMMNGGNLTLNNLTIANGQSDFGAAIEMMGINFSGGNVEANGVTFANNTASSAGGAISIVDGTFTARNSTFVNNNANSGGALFINGPGAQFTAINSTFSNNSPTINANSGTITLIQSTVYTTAGSNVNLYGEAHITFQNSLLAGNEWADCYIEYKLPNIWEGSVTFNGNNLFGATTASNCFEGSLEDNNIISGDAKLLPLANNGGPTQTHALRPGSLAFEAGSDTDVAGLVTDQRGSGYPRILGNAVDIGAYEAPADLCTGMPNPIADADDLITAIDIANCDPADNVLELQADTTYTLTTINSVTTGGTGLPSIDSTSTAGTLTINGNGATITRSDVDGTDDDFRLFFVTPDGDLTLNNVTVAGGHGIYGGAIYNQGTLEINGSTFSNNLSDSSGGAIDNDGTLTITNSTFSGNEADSGGGIANWGSLTVSNSTVSNNSAQGQGGGIYQSNGGSTANLSFVTLTGNTADSDNDDTGLGGGIFRNAGTITLRNSIIVGNSDAGGSFADCGANAGNAYTISTGSQNLVGSNGSANGCTTGTGVTVVAAGLDADDVLETALANNGGDTETHALVAASPALDLVPSDACTTIAGDAVSEDQRGEVRPQVSGCDVGAYEAAPFCPEFPATIASGDVDALIFAIECANAAATDDVINLTAGTPYTLSEYQHSEAFWGATGLPIIANNGTLTINGNGAIIERSTVTGTPDFRLFRTALGTAQPGVTLTLNNLTLRNGVGTIGGAILADRYTNLTIDDSIITSNQTSNISGGGGIYVNHYAHLILTDSEVSHNTAQGGNGGGIGMGSNASLNVSNSTIDNNTASNGAGGGINAYTSPVNLVNTTISNNQAKGASGVGGGLYSNSGIVTVDSSSINDNTANSSGGGIYGATLSVTNSTLAGNSSNAIYGTSVSTGITINNTTISGDFTVAGTPPVTINNTIITNAGTSCVRPNNVTINGSNNLATDASCGAAFTQVTSAQLNLGSLANNGGPTQTIALGNFSAALDAGNNTLIPTSILYDQRGSSYPRIMNDTVDIGAYEADDSVCRGTIADPITTTAELIAAIDIANCDPADNTINLQANATFTLTEINNTNDGPNGLPSIIAAGGKLTINGNDAIIERAENAEDDFRLFYIAVDANLELNNVTLRNATASGNGGAISSNGQLSISNGTFTNNHASNNGSALYIASGSEVSITDSVFEDNIAGVFAVIINYGDLTIAGSTFTGNEGLALGGVLNEATMSVTNSTFVENVNVALQNNNGGQATITNSTFADNPNIAIANSNGSDVTIANSTFVSNPYAINPNGGQTTITNSTFVSNGIAINPGGGSSTEITVNNTLIANSTSNNCWTAQTDITGTNNLSTDGSCGAAFTQVTSTALRLGTFNGQYVPLLAGSAAIDAGDNDICSTAPVNGLDQIGNSRPYPEDGLCDVGAIEAQFELPSLSITDVTLAEGNSGTTTFTFTVSLDDEAPLGGVVFDIATTDGTATTTDSDYVSVSLTAQTIEEGETSTTVSVTVNGDTKYEVNESFTVTVSNIIGAVAGDTEATGTITNDDLPPSLSINDVSLAEGNSGTTSFTFTITQSAISGLETTVNVATADDSATVADGDYDAASTTLTFAANTATLIQTFTVTVNGDDFVEQNEVFFVNLTNLVNATSGDSQGTGTITNDDVAGIIVGTISGPTSEDLTEATFTITLSSRPTADVTIPLTSSDTTEGSVPSSVTIEPEDWQTGVEVTVTGVDDDVDDGDIAYTIQTGASQSTDANYAGTDPADVSVTNNDDDTAGITVEQSGGTTEVTEGSTSADSYSIVLDSEPTANVTITITADAQTELAPDEATTPDASITLTFTPLNWNMPQDVFVYAVDDDVDEAQPHNGTITHSIESSDSNYDVLTLSNITVSVTDNDAAGFVVSAISGNTTEAGGEATFTVALATQPTANVTIGLSSSDTTEGTVSPDSLTFTPDDWDTEQTVTVKGVDDDVDDGDVSYTIIIAAATSDDLFYSGLNAADVSVSNTDDDTAGVTITQTSGTTAVSEASADTDSYTVVLDSEPIANVTITVAADAQTELAPDTTTPPDSEITLTFTPSNWQTPQDVFVYAVDDDIDETATHTGTITHSPSSTDTKYNALTISSVSVSITDDDEAGVSLSESSGTTEVTEGGATDTYTVLLTSEPTDTVTVTVTADTQTRVASASATTPAASVTLTFDDTNWNVAQTITVSAYDDDIDEASPHSGTITHSAASSDAYYNGLTISSVSVSITDNDEAGITVSDISGDTSEPDGTATFTVVLDSEPTADVIISLSSSDTSEGSVDKDTLTFTSENWDTAQTVTVTGADDDLDDGDIDYAIQFSVSSSDTTYGEMTLPDLAVTNIDDDTVGVTTGAVSGPTTEAGGTATFTVVLDSQPTADVTIAVSSLDTSEGNVTEGSTLTFTPGNWDSAQTVTVTGANDSVQDGDVAYSISLTVTSTDALYNGMQVTSVSVTNNDDDTAGVTITPTSGLLTSESGTTATFTIVLETQPTADVTITLSGDSTEGTITPDSLTFTPGNWNEAQEVTVEGVDDSEVDGNIDYTITTSITTADTVYSAINPADVSVTNTDDDSAGITVLPTDGLVTTEAGGTATFTVVLNSSPSQPVTITVSSDNPAEGTVDQSTLTFTNADWNVAQTVTITGVDDTIVDGSVTYNITLSATSDDPNYSSIDPTDVEVMNLDDDSATVVVSPTRFRLSADEDDDEVRYRVWLTQEPASTVTISIQATTGCRATPNTLTFDPSDDWNEPQTVRVRVNGSCTLTHTATGGGYDGADIADVEITKASANNALPEPQPAVETFLCVNLASQTGGAMAGQNGIGNISLNDMTGDTYCHTITQDTVYRTNPAEIGNMDIIQMGVVQAVDVFGMVPGGYTVTQFTAPVQICLRGSGGSVTFISAVDGSIQALPATINGGYQCVELWSAGKLILAGGSPNPGATLPNMMSTPPTTNMSVAPTPLNDCRITTTAIVRLRTSPDTSSENIITRLPYNITLTATESVDGWYRVIYEAGQGWVSADYVTTTGTCE